MALGALYRFGGLDEWRQAVLAALYTLTSSGGPLIRGTGDGGGNYPEETRCDSLPGPVQTARLAGLCSWAGSVDMIGTSCFLSVLISAPAPGEGRDD